MGIALFLIAASLTESVAAFKNELDVLFNPALYRTRLPSADAKPLDPLSLRAKIDAQLPRGLSVWELPLLPPTPGRAVLLNLNSDGPRNSSRKIRLSLTPIPAWRRGGGHVIT